MYLPVGTRYRTVLNKKKNGNTNKVPEDTKKAIFVFREICATILIYTEIFATIFVFKKSLAEKW